MIDKKRTKHLVNNLISCLPIFILAFAYMLVNQHDTHLSFSFSIAIYVYWVSRQSDFDYLQEQIDDLKNKN
jgi:hypothetical protein